jgi:hypothetical protein
MRASWRRGGSWPLAARAQQQAIAGDRVPQWHIALDAFGDRLRAFRAKRPLLGSLSSTPGNSTVTSIAPLQAKVNGL